MTRLLWIFLSLALALTGGLPANAEPPAGPAAAAPLDDDDINWARHVVEAYREFQTQQEQTLRALETTRAEAATATSEARADTAALTARLAQIESAMNAQRERELAALEASHRRTLRVIGAFAALGFLGMIVLAWMLYRAISRRVERATATLAQRPAAAGLLATGEQALVGQNPAAQSSARFLSAIERLEQRLAAMEAETVEPDAEPAAPTTDVAAPAAPAETDETTARVALLLAKGQSLFNLEQFAEAEACFDEALELDADNAEAHVRKGSALEAQEKVDAALDHYDRAIALDDSLTMAYLRKGGVYNRLERYGEALECYERALRSQQKPRFSEVGV